ncbi:hypothetical protein E4U09_000267 [Claviceps aff. purpurea]|uniref:Uncharacterized protein n=1 Tax=Claviceps aff. purpurea TaxID=1967640 RepID=A0A9P7QKZ9_9HYPO|nr:hypothetical protein E4U09_000267 [Claviceps aff. purpurea]
MSIETSGIAALKSWKTSVGTAIPFPEGEDEEIEALVRAKNPKALAHLEGLFSKVEADTLSQEDCPLSNRSRWNGNTRRDGMASTYGYPFDVPLLLGIWIQNQQARPAPGVDFQSLHAHRQPQQLLPTVMRSPIPSTYEKKNLPVLRGTPFVLSRRSLYLSCARKVETALAPSADSHSCTAASATSSADFLYGGSTDLLQAPSSYVDGVKSQVGSPHVRSSFGLFPGRSSCFISVFMGRTPRTPRTQHKLGRPSFNKIWPAFPTSSLKTTAGSPSQA